VNPFVSRKWIETAGSFTPLDFQGWFADEWVWTIAAELRRAVYLPDVKIIHHQLGNDPTYRDGRKARAKVGGINTMRDRFFSPPVVERRNQQIERLRAEMVTHPDLIPDPRPAWFNVAIERGAVSSPRVQEARVPQTEKTLVAVHCYAGDADLVRAFLPQYLHHETNVLILSPENAPVNIDHPRVECRSAGKAAYFGEDSLERQRLHLQILLEYPYDWFLLNDSDSMCLSRKIPEYLYQHPGTVWSNEVSESRPHTSPYPKIAFHPPYFLDRQCIERMLEVADTIETHPITPFIDWYMLALTMEAGLKHRSFLDGASFPAWVHGRIPETKKLGHDYVHVQASRGVDGARKMQQYVRRGTVMVHSVKHPPVRDKLVEAHTAFLASKGNKRMRNNPIVEQPDISTVKVSILMPFRDDGNRLEVKNWVEARWRKMLPDAEFVFGEDEGQPYSKTTAVNDAFMKSTGDVLVVVDADTVVDYDTIRAGIAASVLKDQLVVPWNRSIRLSEVDTQNILEDGIDAELPWRGDAGPSSRTAGMLYVISRKGFQAVNGMDPRFRGWGWEDVMFNYACMTMLGSVKYLEGRAYALYHPVKRVEGKGRVWGEEDPGRANLQLKMAYSRARARRKLMKEIVDQHPLGGEAAPIPTSPSRPVRRTQPRESFKILNVN
jgi:hypothetical protein